MRPAIIIAAVLVFFSFVVGLYLYPNMPATLDSHWNSAGQADGTSSKFSGLFAIPIVSLVLFLVMLFIPRIDPRKENIKKFQGYYDAIVLVMVVFFFYVYVLSIWWNLGWRFNFGIALLPAFTVLFWFMGLLLEKAKMNWFIGIRTPWTLSSERVWNKTHKVGARLFKVAALITLLGLVFRDQAILFVIVPVVVFAIYLIAYSYVEYRRKKH
ncbi:SdpI family protein [Candidatus Pacearchaeota archaeon]|nr:SdpI family protein [Candidatus Pacearchaeota archaeon]